MGFNERHMTVKMVKRLAKRGPTAKKNALVRGEPVVRGILAATMEELAHTGYSALRIEDVATRAGVNKTTIYRRWPTKEELVRAALLSMGDDTFCAPNTGSLRLDLLAAARKIVAIAGSPQGRSISRVIVAEGPDSELMTIAKSLRDVHEVVLRSMIEAAKSRGEIAPGIDAMLLFNVLGAIIHERLFLNRESIDDGFLNSLLDLLLLGASPRTRPT
jgi:AcrR family transcriptional regulator